jgi:hypothetical protein
VLLLGVVTSQDLELLLPVRLEQHRHVARQASLHRIAYA